MENIQFIFRKTDLTFQMGSVHNWETQRRIQGLGPLPPTLNLLSYICLVYHLSCSSNSSPLFILNEIILAPRMIWIRNIFCIRNKKLIRKTPRGISKTLDSHKNKIRKRSQNIPVDFRADA